MKKIIILLFATLLLIGCEIDALNYYKDAVVKTESLVDGQSQLAMTLNFDFVDASSEQEIFKEITFTHQRKFGDKQEVSRQYLGTSAFGIDTVYYENQEEAYIRLPFLGKYLSLNDIDMSQYGDALYEEPPISQETIEIIKDKWMMLVKEDDVVNLGDEVIDTPEGEVKVKKFVVTFSHEQVTTFLREVIDVVSQDPVFLERITEYPTFVYEDETLVVSDYDITSEEVIKGFDWLLESLIIEDFSMTAYVDIDLYMIQQTYDIKIAFSEKLSEVINGLTFNATYELFDLNQQQAFDFPMIESTDWITVDELLDSFEDYTID